jgi:hypothetical protein
VTGHVSFHAWRSGETSSGVHLGTSSGPTGLSFGEAAGTRVYDDPHGSAGPRTYAWSAWLTPAVTPGHPFTSLVPSWNAATPQDSWLEVDARVSGDDVHWSRWFSLGRWADSDREVHATSVPGQSGDDASVATDVLEAVGDAAWTSYQLRVTFHRGLDSTAVPTLTLLGAVVAHPGEHVVPAPASAPVRSVELPVPAYSQQVHRGEYPHWDSGGQSWCSPTSTTMVLAHWGLGPTDADVAWVDPSIEDKAVDHAARCVFDYAYKGAGNWSFNTAYAARYGVEAFVTRLRSLEEAELFVAAGIPLVASVSFRREELDGAGYDTNGHLLTVIGFDAAGDVVCNDPASHQVPSNDEVRVVYDRKQFEKVWLDAAGGLVYVIHPHDVPLPAHPAATEPSW